MTSTAKYKNILAYLFKDVLLGILKGTKESLHGIYSLHVYYNKPLISESQSSLKDSKALKKTKSDSAYIKDKALDVRSEIYKCCAYNGVIYGVSVFLFYFVVLFASKLVLDVTLSPDTAQHIWNVVHPTLTILFDVLWTVPLFIIFKVINTFWFQDIANSAYKQRYGRPQSFSMGGISNQISDSVFAIIIESLFLVQASSMNFLPYPYIALVLSCVHFSLLNSLYSFEYLWCNKGWTFHKRISYIEANWPYFIGFGMPLSFVTFLLPSYFESESATVSLYLCSGFMYSVFFPLFIISAMEASPVQHESSGPPLKLFTVVVWLSSLVTKKAFTKNASEKKRL